MNMSGRDHYKEEACSMLIVCGDLTRDFASVRIKYRIFVVKTLALKYVIRVKDFIPKQMFELNFDIGI